MEKSIINFKPKVVWDNDFLYEVLTRKILIEKVQFRIKEFIKRGWKFNGTISVEEVMHKCDLCKIEIGIVFYDNDSSNKCLSICFDCDNEASSWRKYIKK